MPPFATICHNWGGKKTKCFIVLPCYNEEQNIEPLVLAIHNTLHNCIPYQIIAVNDGSTDNTRKVFKKLVRQYPLLLLDHHKNKGLAKALNTGLTAAIKHSKNNDIIITMDADQTHDPKYIPNMVNATKEADVIIASRYAKNSKQQNIPPHRQILSKIINTLISTITKLPIKDATSGYRCYKAKTLKKLNTITKNKLIESRGFEVAAELLLKTFWKGATIKEIPIILDYSQKRGGSKMRLIPTIKRYIILLHKIRNWRKTLQRDW